MAVSDIAVSVTVKPRRFLSTVARLPFAFGGHFRFLRKQGNSVALSAAGAWFLCGLIVTFRK